jgi:aminodeoxyfutalosine synthase
MDLRTMAISRLMLDNIPHIKAYWIMLGIGTAQTALAYGADDLDGTVRHELIYHDAGRDDARDPAVGREIRRLIVEAGREPVERDTLYRFSRQRDDLGNTLTHEKTGEHIAIGGIHGNFHRYRHQLGVVGHDLGKNGDSRFFDPDVR